jgi:hypothetical protein
MVDQTAGGKFDLTVSDTSANQVFLTVFRHITACCCIPKSATFAGPEGRDGVQALGRYTRCAVMTTSWMARVFISAADAANADFSGELFDGTA